MVVPASARLTKSLSGTISGAEKENPTLLQPAGKYLVTGPLTTLCECHTTESGYPGKASTAARAGVGWRANQLA